MHQLDIYVATLPPGPPSSSTFLIRVWDRDTADWGVRQQKSFKRRLLCQIKICTEPRCNDVKSNFSLVANKRISQFWYRYMIDTLFEYNISGVKLQWRIMWSAESAVLLAHLLHFLEVQARSLNMMNSACPGLFPARQNNVQCSTSGLWAPR